MKCNNPNKRPLPSKVLLIGAQYYLKLIYCLAKPGWNLFNSYLIFFFSLSIHEISEFLIKPFGTVYFRQNVK